MRPGSERGDVILTGLLKMVAGLLVLGVVLFDGGAVAINHIQLDEAARVAARLGSVVWSSEHSTVAVEQAVRERLSRETGVALQEVAVDHDRVAVTVTRRAPVLLLDRLGPLAAYAQGSATSTAAPPSPF